MAIFGRKRYLIVVCTKYTPKSAKFKPEECEKIKSVLDSISWTGVFASGSVPADWSRNKVNDNLFCPIDKAFDVRDVHEVLDNLPADGPNDYLLDVLWLTDNLPSPQKLHPSLYGSLRRCVDWHGGAITIISQKGEDQTHSYLKDLRAELVSLKNSLESLPEFMDPKLCWRGSLAFFDDSDMTYQSINGFEMSNTSSNEAMSSVLDSLSSKGKSSSKKNLLWSQRLKVITKCTMSSIPTYFLTNQRCILRTSLLSEDNDVAEDFWSSTEMFGSHNCVIVKLEHCERPNFAEAKTANRLTTESWKKFILDGNSSVEEDRPLLKKNLDSLYFLICNDDQLESGENYAVRRCHEKLCIFLNPYVMTGGLTKSFDVVHDALCRDKSDDSDFSGKFRLLDINTDIYELSQMISRAPEIVFDRLKMLQPDSTLLLPENREDVVKVITSKVIATYLEKKSFADSESGDNFIEIPRLNGEEMARRSYESFATVESEEKRFLAFVEHCKNIKEDERKRSRDTTMKPSGDFVILEAKEMLKIFEKAGDNLLPAGETRAVEPLETVDRLKKPESWPEILLNDFHDLYYNKGEKSEEKDREMAKIQRMFVGSRETASTCHGLNASQNPVIVSKAKTEATRKVSAKKKSPKSTAVSAKKITAPPKEMSAKEQAAIYKQKLRGAVYDALVDRGIGEKDTFFRPCFKRLFEMCNVFAKDMPKQTLSTKKWLATVAMQNVDTVINLEKTLRTST